MNNAPVLPSSLSIIAVLSASEVALGGFLHSLHLPLTGQLLSLNQCFWLNISTCWSPAHSPSKISLQVAAIKAMTPLGKRLTPMLAIAMQGVLFEGGYRVFGRGIVGRIMGSLFMSFWSFVQPAILYGLLLGYSFTDMNAFLTEQTGINVATWLIISIGAKAIAAMAVSLAAHVLASRVQVIEQYGSWLESLGKNLYQKNGKPGWKKVCRSPFFISFVLIHIYLFFTAETIEYFFRQSLFYLLWTVALFYLWNGLERKMLSIIAR